MHSRTADHPGTDGERRLPEQIIADASRTVSGVLAKPGTESEAVIKHVLSDLTNIPATQYNAAYASVLLDCAHFFHLAATPLPGIPICARAVEISRTLNERPLLRKALTFLGAMHADTGSLPAATTAYAEAMDIAISLDDRFAQAVILNLLGSLLLSSSQSADALACFERTTDLAATDDPKASDSRWRHRRVGRKDAD